MRQFQDIHCLHVNLLQFFLLKRQNDSTLGGAMVLHTAHEHIIYAGSAALVNEATQRNSEFIDGWLAVIGQAFYDPVLIAEYGLQSSSKST